MKLVGYAIANLPYKLVNKGDSMSNSVFMNGNPVWANACVGENGFINYLTYATGYSKASNLLLDHVLDQGSNEIDSFIYPICFNMRHSIELRLKGAIDNIKKLAQMKNVSLEFNLAKQHDILNIWNFFEEKSKSLDKRFININQKLEKTIIDIGKIDSTGQTFRYPYDTENQKHLTDTKLINCRILKEVFNQLEKDLDELDTFIKVIIEEYKIGTFTQHLSRKDIFELANNLPQRDRWNPELDKEGIKDQYGIISNKELTKVINFIERNYETKPLIGLPNSLEYLNDDTLVSICEIWTTDIFPDFNERDDEPRIVGSDELYSVMVDDFKNGYYNTGQIHQELNEQLDVNVISDLHALFYLSSNSEEYSERYGYLCEEFRKELLVEDNLLARLDDILTKKYFLKQIMKSLYFLNLIDLAEAIIQKLNIEDIKHTYMQKNASIRETYEILGYEISA